MTIEKTIFNVIVPLEFDMNDFKKLTKGEGLEEFRKVFDSEPLRDTEHPVKTESLKGESPILKNEENAYMMRFKIAVNQRTAIGLSCEEDCIYTHKASKIRFRISNVRLWFTRWGIAFLTLEISGENLTNDEILDLNAILSTILQLRYAKDAVCWNDNEGHTIEGEFTFYNMIRSFTNLQRDIPLESRYKDKTHCLFYGVADEIKDDSDTKKGMETLCRQLKSGLRTPKEVATLYYPFDKQHICWIFSENVLAGIGDIKKCKNENDKATEENDKNFLREILQESIQDNYLPLYLYYLSLRFLVGLLMEKCESAEVRKHSGEREEVKQQLGLLQELVENDDNPKNRKLRELALYDFINDIFDYYLCEKTWGLLKSLDALLSKYLPKFNKKNPWDVFFSYRRKGGFFPARLLYEALKAQGRKPFLDLEDLGSGSFAENLEVAIENSDAVAIIFSKGCFDEENRCCDDKDVTDWVREEIKKAVELKKEKDIKIIPIAVDDFKFPEELPGDIYDLISKENSMVFGPKMHALEGAMKDLCKLLDE